MQVFQAQIIKDGKYQTPEFATKEEAIAAVEAAGDGSVVGFTVRQNLPFLLPELVYNSFSMDTFEDGKWRKVNIFGG